MYKRRGRKLHNKKTRMNFSGILVIISIAIFLGYGAARFVIYPLLGTEPSLIMNNIDREENQYNNKSLYENETKDKTILEDQLKVDTEREGMVSAQGKNDSKLEGYYIQFGSFSNKESAEKLIKELSDIGIKAEVIDNNGIFKVRSTLFDTKEGAQAMKATLAGTQYTDAFITR